MRYLCNFSTDDLDKEYYDVVIVGSGIAGLYTALNLDNSLKVALLSKTSLDENNTSLAQGGIAAAIKDNDSPRLHMTDTLRAGDWVNDEKAVEVLVNEAKENIANTLEIGINYDRDEEGSIVTTLEGGHSRRRILHAGGDATGREIHRGLMAEALSRDNITIFREAFGVDILVINNRCCGILVEVSGRKRVFYSRALVLAAGGTGQVYDDTTNSRVATGDGIAMASRAGARLKDMEFVQFHPTTFHCGEFKSKYGRNFLISEAVRGEGALLRNRKGKRFMEDVDGQELAPRDVVARKMFMEMHKEGSKYLYLDITHKDREFLVKRFPTIYTKCRDIGIDMAKDYIPVAPAAHYMMGGIEVDLMGRTSVPSLYGCGECSCTGVHGANRLASNSLLEGLVFGRRIALDINRTIGDTVMETADVKFGKLDVFHSLNWGNIISRIRKIMNRKAGIIRTVEDLSDARDQLEDILRIIQKADCQASYEMEIRNMAETALNIVKAALARKESCGAHYIIRQGD